MFNMTTNDELIYYVYVILDPRKPGKYTYNELTFDYEPFYIGKGCGNRYATSTKESKINTKKGNKLKAISKRNDIPIVFKIKEKITENNAFEYEIYYINLIGRSDLKKGPLTNHTNHTDGGDGSSGRININLFTAVDQYSLDGTFIKSYYSITEATKDTGIFGQNISSAINGIYNSAGNFLWCRSGEKIVIPEEKKLNKRTILQYDLDGNFIKEWDKLTTAANATGANNIVPCCKGTIRNSGGFVWRYKNITESNGYLNHNINELNHSGNFNKSVHSDEALYKLKHNKVRAVLQMLNNNIIAEYFSISEAYRQTKINKSAIVMCCKNTRNKAGGYAWQYK